MTASYPKRPGRSSDENLPHTAAHDAVCDGATPVRGQSAAPTIQFVEAV